MNLDRFASWAIWQGRLPLDGGRERFKRAYARDPERAVGRVLLTRATRYQDRPCPIFTAPAPPSLVRRSVGQHAREAVVSVLASLGIDAASPEIRAQVEAALSEALAEQAEAQRNYKRRRYMRQRNAEQAATAQRDAAARDLAERLIARARTSGSAMAPGAAVAVVGRRT